MFRSTSQMSASTTQSTEELFATHQQLARRFTWHRKLFVASRVALIVAIIGLIAYVLFAHRLLLQLSPLAFLVALLIPNRGGRERALEHIDEDIGLSYRTALEYQNNQVKSAEYAESSDVEQVDFSSLLLRRAAYRVRNLELPDLQPWWLPMLVTSLVLSLVPFFINATPLNFGGRGLLGNNNGQNPLTQPFQNQEAPEDEQAVTDEESVDELTEEDASEFATQEENDADLENSFEDSATEPDRNVSEAEGETLSRFLENLKEKPQVEEENSAQQAGQNRRSSEETPDSDAEATDEAEQGRNGEQSSRQNGDSQEGAQAQEESDDGQEGEQQADSGSEEGEPEGDEQRPGEDEGQAGEQGDEQGARAEEGGRQEGDEQDSFSGEDNQNGIGNSASDPTPNSEERLEGQMQTPELLEGQILSDDTTIAGDVRIPGSDQVALPEGNSANDFDRAVERAIAEGRIPVEYQEILKNYFR